MNDPAARALIVVDVQRDFLPGGALAVTGGDAVLAPIRTLMERGRFGLQVATQDWHPAGHVSFASAHPGTRPFDSIPLYGHDQTLWPDHCVQGTPGAALDPALPWDRVSAIIRKGTDPACDSYSAIRNNWNAAGERPPTGLAGYLSDLSVREVWVCGLTRDFCALWTAEDAAAAGFHAALLWDLTRPVDPAADEAVRARLRRAGVGVIEGNGL
ncbi:MAG: nicotinamidase [Acidobacteriota bacterium]|nr:nicotinamidase [Acidobacteriota bacterium]